MWACWVCRFFGIKNIGSLTLGMSNLGAASGTLNSGTDDDNDATCLEGGCVGTLNVGGEGRSVLGMPSFGIEKNGMSGTLMSRTGKTTASGTTLRSLGRMWWGTTGRRQQCPILALTLASLLALPIAAVTIARCRSQRQGRPEDVIATAKTLSPPPPLTDIAARPPPPLKTMTAISTQPLQRPSTSSRPPLSLLPSPLHLLQPLSPSLPSQLLSPLSLLPLSPPPPPLPPPPMPPPPHPHHCLRRHHCCSLCQRHCTSNAPVDGWLLCPLLLLACCVVRHPNLSAPPRRAVIDVNDDRYRCRR